MFNNITLVGRLTHHPELKVLADGKKVLDIQIAVQRPFKNTEGIYETDFLTVTLWQGMAENLSMYCTKGSQVLISGRVQVRQVQTEERDYKTLDIIGERVVYLGSKKEATVSVEDFE